MAGQRVNGTFGVASLIMGVEQPIPVPRGIVETLAAATESSGTIPLDPDLEIGQMVRILSGPFAETLCRLVRLDDEGRVRVLLKFMGAELSAATTDRALRQRLDPATGRRKSKLADQLDRNALPRPDADQSNPSEIALTLSETQKALLADIWRHALGLERIGLHDNFFELGGHSLLAVRVIAEINKTLNMHVR